MRNAAVAGQAPLYFTKYDAHPTPEGYKVIAGLVSPLVLDASHAQSSADLPGVK
jgi:hypothetical protein